MSPNPLILASPKILISPVHLIFPTHWKEKGAMFDQIKTSTGGELHSRLSLCSLSSKQLLSLKFIGRHWMENAGSAWGSFHFQILPTKPVCSLPTGSGQQLSFTPRGLRCPFKGDFTGSKRWQLARPACHGCPLIPREKQHSRCD